ncbi:hypothetical protein [Granulicella sibirica]|uniref:DUF429 domain-containing protein n=1 Tax=Granulicella sibirica TaxID=2479048 RepID=A0A4Q0SUK4_9BACT|nr:hypothetical protein [Granulicella sibirica]RXH54407.1 hypothetical protein GRAN_4703 [Granulicella sibirica]
MSIEAGMDRVVAVDWSGDKGPGQRKKIWAGVWTASPKGRTMGGTVTLEGGRTRDELSGWLVEMARQTPRMVVGFDFIFSYPAWFLKEHGVASAEGFWRSVASGQGEKWLARECEDIRFWGKPRKKPEEFCGPLMHRMMRRTDMEVKVVAQIAEPAKAARVVGIAPKSPFQIGGSGSVGTGSLRGMPYLLKLREAGFSVWPFDVPSFPMVVEMYSRLMTGPVNKSSEEARTAYLARKKKESAAFVGLSRAVIAAARESEDAFDALVSCLVMTEFRGEFPELRQATDPAYAIEGQTWTPGVGR